MGVDIATYRCRVGLFVTRRGAGMPFYMSFSQLVKLIGSLAFIRLLLVMASIEQNPGPTEKFIFRYQYLLVEIGTKLIRQFFEVSVGHDCAKHLTKTAVAQTLQNLITAKKITSDQARYLPPKEMKPDSSKFDISLLSCLLRNVCGLRHPHATVWMNPLPADTSEEADIARLRICRNWLMHIDTLVLSEADFDAKWKDLSGILIRLNKTCGITGLSALIDSASKMETDNELKDRLDQTLKAWDAMDQDMISKLDRVEKRCAYGHDRAVKRIKTVELGVATLVKKVTSVHRGLSTIQKDIAELKRFPIDDENVIQRKLIAIYERECHLLQVTPFIEDDNEDLMSIYQSPTLQHTVCDRYQTKGKQKQISSYKELFYKDDKPAKRVYITGDAGVGKTSMCRRMCLLWSKSRLGDYAGNDEGAKRDMKFLEKFDFLFYVSLGLTDKRDMIMMIIDQLFYTECDNERADMYKLIKSILNQHDSLIVLDGFDEWNPKTSGKHDCIKTPKGIESEKCVFLTTCRSYKLENVRLSESDIDHQLELTGIHGLSSEHYVIEVVKYMNMKNHDNKNADKFLEEVKQCELYDQLSIPLISSLLVVVWWYNQKLTGVSKAFLYGKILEMLFKRAERKKVDFLSFTSSELKLPNCFSQLDYINEQVFLLKKVCLLSFNSFFKQDDCATALVFTKKQLMSPPYLFTTDEMDFLYKIGITSKKKVIGCFEEQKQILSFVHRSYIEFFSALYVSSFDACNTIDSVVKKWSSLNDVLEYQNFFQFLAGLSGQKLKFLLENIYSLLSDHLKLWRKYAVENYRKDTSLFYTNSYMDQLMLFQATVVNCFIEINRSNDPGIELKLEDFIFDDKSNIDILKQLFILNKTCVKSTYSVFGKYYDEFDQIRNLECLHIDGVLSADHEKFTEYMLHNQSTLHTVCIKGSIASYTLIPELPVSSLQHLTSLSLSSVKMPHDSLHNLVKFLSDNVRIENIKLSSVYCANHLYMHSNCTLTLNLPRHTKLTSLYVVYVNILCNDINNSSLKSVTFYPLSESRDSCCIDVFNCIKYSQLEHLDIYGGYSDVLGNWYMLHYSIMFGYDRMKTLACTVKTLVNIKLLKLGYMKLPDDVLLQLHPDVTQVKIKLKFVTMSRQCFHCFIESLVNNESVIKVWLYDCNITSDNGENHKELSRKESWDYMSEYLTSIHTINITDKFGTRLCFETRRSQ